MSDTVIIRKFPALIKQFEEILKKAQTHRQERVGLVDLPKIYGVIFNNVPEWNLYEMRVMQDTVNQERKDNALSLVTLDDIRRAESGAVGHSDYPHKFALYCAELALNLK
jgi:hypothetical protein